MRGRWPRGGFGRAWGVLALWLAALVMAPGISAAQQFPAPGLPVLSLDQEQFFALSQFGTAALAANKVAVDALAAEFVRLESALEAEERDLTTRRAGLTVAEFNALALAFDTKVEAIRTAQKARPAMLQQALDDEKLRFFDAARPVLGALMAERGAFAIIDKRAVVLGFEAIDLTPVAIARINAVLGDGRAVLPAP